MIIIFLILFTFILVDMEGKDVSNGKVYNTTDNCKTHDEEEEFGIGYNVLANKKRVDLNNKNDNFNKRFRFYHPI